jgi:two-component system response regulator MprA
VGDAAGAMARAGDARDALVIDIGLPDADGRDVCQALRPRGVDPPAIFLTARDALAERLAGFSAGGDAYLTKPFRFDELVARLRALLLRSGADRATTLGGLCLDPVTHAITGDDGEVSLTPTEFRVLATLATSSGAIVRRRDLVRAAWPEGAVVHKNTLDPYVARPRRTLYEVSARAAIETAHDGRCRLG